MQREVEELRFSKEASELLLRDEIKCVQPAAHPTRDSPIADVTI